jgi:1,4-alpha-glucan branching enzyme
MSKFTEDPVIDRGVALHKLIRFATMTMGGEGYLNFMGNEFGHPEWIDFPREGNGWSYFYCRRQWHLADDKNLRYGDLLAFDKQMLAFLQKHKIFASKPKSLYIDNDKKILVYERKNLIFAINFNPSVAYNGYYLTVNENADYKVIFSTDRADFGGYDRIDEKYVYTAKKDSNGENKIQIYLPPRTALVLKKVAKRKS